MGQSPWGGKDDELDDEARKQDSEALGSFLQSVLSENPVYVFKGKPLDVRVTMETRKAVLNEISNHIAEHVPTELAYAMKCTLLHYGVIKQSEDDASNP
jgi:hypothetical protein